mmetsp:Transcript_33765/g.74347  ORF Transcript_33765/g.74347 Transcript_33765/m.74347 type:complete len:204 (-) Transcript_33765:661-1272(-)
MRGAEQGHHREDAAAWAADGAGAAQSGSQFEEGPQCGRDVASHHLPQHAHVPHLKSTQRGVTQAHALLHHAPQVSPVQRRRVHVEQHAYAEPRPVEALGCGHGLSAELLQCAGLSQQRTQHRVQLGHTGQQRVVALPQLGHALLPAAEFARYARGGVQHSCVCRECGEGVAGQHLEQSQALRPAYGGARQALHAAALQRRLYL